MVEIKSIAREAGYRSKVAVSSRQEGVDPVGSCVGLRGIRIQNIVNELNGERIDVIQWDAEAPRFVANALSPAQVLSVSVEDAANTASVIVPDRQLSLAIGKEGQNARLAAKLTGWRIDIKPESAMQEHLAAHPDATSMTTPPPSKAPASAGAHRPESPEVWKEVIEGEEGVPARVAASTAAPAGPRSGLRFAEDLAPAINQPATKKSGKKGKKERTTQEEGVAKAKTPSKRASRRFAVVDEDEDFAEMLEEYVDTPWEEEKS